MVKVLILTFSLLAIAIIGMAIKILFHKTHRFPETSAGHNPEMIKRGISCPKKEEPFCNGSNKSDACSGCSVN